MSTNINAAAETAREQARRGDGTFGEQNRAEVTNWNDPTADITPSVDTAELRQQLFAQVDAAAPYDGPDRTAARTKLMFDLFYDDEPDEPDQAIRDALTDLIHAANSRGVDIDEAFSRADGMARMEQEDWGVTA